MGTMRTIEDNNKLIAEFLGYVQPHPDYPKSTYWYKKDESPLTILPFNYDWNWLMKVVDKIEDIEDEEGFSRYVFEIFLSNVNIIDNRYILPVIETYERTKIEATYNAVIEFIKYYNNENN